MGEKQQSKGACVNSIAINTANNSLLETATVVFISSAIPIITLECLRMRMRWSAKAFVFYVFIRFSHFRLNNVK